MAFKIPFLSKLFFRLSQGTHLGKRPEEQPEADAPPGETVPMKTKAPEAAPPAPGVVKLDEDHTLYGLRALRRRQSGNPLPPPHIELDPGVIGEGVLEREKSRLQKALTVASNARFGKAFPPKPKEGKPPPPPLLDAWAWVFVANDKLSAWLLAFPPVGEGQELNRGMLDEALSKSGVVSGIDDAALDSLATSGNRYFKLILAARGRPAVNGEDGKIIERFARKVEKHFQVDENDRMDYTNLNLVQNVGQGDEICAMVLPTEGQPGKDVYGHEIPAKNGRKMQLPKGRNTEISEDGLSLIASAAGHVEFTGRSFQVKPVLEIGGDVDYSTGNINFLGDVHIQGDVCSGFLVRAMGSVNVDGVISGGTVEAGGDLVVAKGILGGEQTVVRAHRSIFAKYLENCVVYVRENLQTDCIINSEVFCDGNVEVESGRGVIMGGRVWAARKVTAKVVGSRSEVPTAITLGGLPCSDSEKEQLLKQLAEKEEELRKIELQPESRTKSGRAARARMKVSGDRLRLEQLERELDDLKEASREQEGRRMESGIVYPGTEITIGEASLRVRHETHACVAALIAGEIHLT